MLQKPTKTHRTQLFDGFLIGMIFQAREKLKRLKAVDAELLEEVIGRRECAGSHVEMPRGEIHDFPRHLSQHVGGMVIASDPLVECVPVQPAAWPNRYVCHWDKDSVDDARMVKIDFLGLGMLSLVEECLDLVAEHRGDLIDLSRITYDDQRVFDRIQEGDTVGVFQIESRAQAQMLPRTQPRTLDDLTVQVAIVRPGPIVGGAVNPYVKAREAQREGRSFQPKAMHRTVEGVLKETLGVVPGPT